MAKRVKRVKLTLEQAHEALLTMNDEDLSSSDGSTSNGKFHMKLLQWIILCDKMGFHMVGDKE